jgi:ABC-type uncharacterized transport system fused permease/ATPase subunit
MSFAACICRFLNASNLSLTQQNSPPGTLRDQLLYPSMVNELGEIDTVSQSVHASGWSNEDLLTVLLKVDLPDLASRSGDGDPIKGLSTKLE